MMKGTFLAGHTCTKVRGRRAILFVCFMATVLAVPVVQSASFTEDLQVFTAFPNRLAGSEGARAAAGHLERRLAEIGVDEVFVQHFPSVQNFGGTPQLRIEKDGRILQLAAMRPNGIISPATPPEGISGKLLFAGSGRPAEYGTRNPEGSIVVLDYNAGANWLMAFRLGAAAVIFIRGEDGLRADQAHFVDANANLPRFYYDGDTADLKDGDVVTVFGGSVWEASVGRNVFGFIRGTDPTFYYDRDEVMVLAAPIDSFGEVPVLSPGARGAANMAGLLQVAAHLQENRPRRHVLIAFFDNQARGHEGARMFYRALDSRSRDVSLTVRRESLEAEERFLLTLAGILGDVHPLEKAGGDLYIPLFNRMRLVADESIENSRMGMAALRLQASRLRRSLVEDPEVDKASVEARLLEIDAELELLGVPHAALNEFRRGLARRNLLPTTENTLYANTVATVRADVVTRITELQLEKQALEDDERLQSVLGRMMISLHVSAMFGDGTPRWGAFFGRSSQIGAVNDIPSIYGRVLQSIQNVANGMPEMVPHFETNVEQPGRQLFGGRFLVHSGEVAGRFSIYNLVFGTVADPFLREGTPDDIVANLDAARIESAFGEFARFMARAASQDAFSATAPILRDIRYNQPRFRDGRIEGALAMRRTRGSSVANRVATGAVVQLMPTRPPYANPNNSQNLTYDPQKFIAFDNFFVLRAAANGTLSYGPISGTESSFAALFDEQGRVNAVSDNGSALGVRHRIDLMPAKHGALILPPHMTPGPMKVLNGRNNSAFQRNRAYVAATDGVVFWYCEPDIASVKVFGERSAVALNIKNDADGSGKVEAQLGVGLSQTGLWQFPRVSRLAANDLFALNEERLDMMRTSGTANRSLEEINARAQDLLDASASAKDVAAGEALALSSFLASLPVYGSARAMLDDLVKSVLVLLALSVPFGFALERLLIGATNIYKQILWFVGFFCATFLILYLTHPAFAVANTPIIIFLGFAIIVLSVMVISIIMQKFELELKYLQGVASTVHTASVSRFGTVMAAMSMGISTMRRRPVRTALTATTIILLTFTILCFASFGGKIGVNTRFRTALPGYEGVYIHHVNWGSIDPAILDLVEGRWAIEALVAPRYWMLPAPQSDIRPSLARNDGSNPANIAAILGISAAEINQRADLAELFTVPDADAGTDLIWMTDSLGESMQVAPGDKVLLNGLSFTVAPFVRATAWSAAVDMDGSSILPVDFEASGGMTSSTEVDADVDNASAMVDQAWDVLPVDSVVAISAENAVRMQSTLRAITLYVPDTAAAIRIAEDSARMLRVPVAATRDNGVHWHFFGTVLAASGLRDLLMPILLGGLVVFGTMLGSVADREKEIYTFSALGLAPSHVASLFFAEAMVFSVIGGLGGYLTAQGMLEVLKLLASMGLAVVPEINYSSTNAIVTILIVMATVLISAIYPAIKASRSANPGVLRSWKIPRPDGDTFQIVFPFTVSAYDIVGVVSFIKEHFDNFTDTSLGIFMARETALTFSGESDVGLRANLALAPFDLGVTQHLELHSAPSEIPGIDEVNLTLHRLSGQPKDWARLNKILLDDLRRQFLIWRSLPASMMEGYRHKTSAAMLAAEKAQKESGRKGHHSRK
jgi:hypothetical protein